MYYEYDQITSVKLLYCYTIVMHNDLYTCLYHFEFAQPDRLNGDAVNAI